MAFGRLPRDPAIVEVTVFEIPGDLRQPGQIVSARAELVAALGQVPMDGATVRQQPRHHTADGATLASATYALESGAVVERAFGGDSDTLWRIDTLFVDKRGPPWPGMAVHVASSGELLAP